MGSDLNRVGDLEVRIVDKITQVTAEVLLGRLLNLPPIAFHAEKDQLFQLCWETDDLDSSEKDLILVRNPDSSGKQLKIIKVIFNNYDSVNSLANFRIYTAPSITSNGSSLTVYPCREGASLPSSVVNAYYEPTISSRGKKRYSGSTSGGALSSNALVIPIDNGLIIDPGYDMLITGQADGTNRDVSITLLWGEE